MNEDKRREDNRVDVKICGIASPDDYDACNAAGASLIGMVFHPASSRHLDFDAAGRIAAHADSTGNGPARVALCVDMDDAGIERVMDAARPDYLQLHGSETPQRAYAIRGRFGTALIKALGVSNRHDLDASADWHGLADWLLFDARGAGSAPAGGSGRSFDWRVLGDYAGDTPWMLAGGLEVGNVSQALEQSGAMAVDVSSGVESAPGRKDHDLIRAFVKKTLLM